jgi:adenine deaminase
MSNLERRIAVARGDEPADLVVRNGRVLSVFTREWLETDVAVCDGFIAGLGDYEGTDELDAGGRYVVPGLIDAHVHIESSKLLVDEFARLVLPLGTTTVVADPHEIANVLGTDGVHWLADAAAEVPLDIYFTASSCVPASRFESPRRPLTPGDLEGLLRRRRVIGLAEMMNFRGVIAGDPAELAKLALDGASHVDGHAPGVLGRDLQAYASAGIRSDHEARTPEEGRQRLRAGMWLLIREATGARNLRDLVPLVAEFGPSRMAFCTDDRDPRHIVSDGHVNALVRDAVAAGVAPADALVMASLNAATWHRLDHLGAIAPGYQADMLLLDDLERFLPSAVLKAGRPPVDPERPPVPEWVRHSVRIQPLTMNDFQIPWSGGEARVIGIVPGQIVTESLVETPRVIDGAAVSDRERDMVKIAVVERHLGSGHNMVVVGADDGDMARATQRLAELGGGMVVVASRGIRAELPLPVAGLLSDAPVATVVEQTRALDEAAQALGCTLEAPFHTIGFLALSVIPSLKITDHGLVDVDRFCIVPLTA